MKLLVAVILGLIGSVVGNYFCKEDDDCGHLGNMVCMKSMCNYGICGCVRGYAARYVGSERNFQCVLIKKIGEACSTGTEVGVCGAQNAHCGDDGVCHCDPGFVSRFGGETCLLRGSPYNTETCSDGIGSVCGDGTTCTKAQVWYGDLSGQPINGLPNVDFDYTPNVCACGPASHTILPNRYDIAPFMGRKIPLCMPNVVGDFCLSDDMCVNIQEPNGVIGWVPGGGVCGTDNKCVCRGATHKPDIMGMFCAKPIAKDGACAWNRDLPDSDIGICDGEQGLRCGDPCAAATWDGNTGSGNLTCMCDPSWTDGGTCAKKSLGDKCYGDYNCMSYDKNSMCIDGKCTDGAAAIVYGIVTLLMPIVVVVGHL